MKFIYITVLTIIFTTLLGCNDKTSANRKLDDSVASVGIRVVGTQRTAKVNEELTLPISIVSNGSDKIPSLGNPDGSMRVLATYHWLRVNNNIVTWDGLRTELPGDIEKGKGLDVSLKIKAPSTSGTYILEIDLVQEGALWFKDAGSQVARIIFTIIN